MRVDRDGEPVFRPETRRAPGLVGAALGLLVAACDEAAEPAPEAARPAPALLLDETPTSGSLMRNERTPMLPLAESSPTPAVATVVAEPEIEEAVPTLEQMVLTEAKEEREASRRRRRSHTTAFVPPGTVVHPLPPMNVARPDPPLYLGGISYTP